MAEGLDESERPALDALLRRMANGDLRSIVGSIEIALTRLFAAIPNSDTQSLSLCLAARFRVPEVSEVAQDFSPVDGDDEEGSGYARVLRRAWQVLEKLPRSHVENSAAIRSMTFVNGMVPTGEYDPSIARVVVGDGIRAEDLPWGPLREKAEKHPLEAQRELEQSFDRTLRHEIGHAVDAQLGASSTYSIRAEGGGWRDYGRDRVAFARDLLAAAGVASHLSGAQLGDLEAKIGTVIEKGSYAELDSLSGTVPEPVRSILPTIRTCLEATGNLGYTPGQVLGTRGFAMTLDRRGASYSASSVAHRVSDYQFVSPHEWFAEAYAAYYDPAVPRGQRLTEKQDYATKSYFDKTVHPFVCRHPSTSSDSSHKV